MIKAVIFDMDGVLFDTEPMVFEATKKLFEKYNVKIKHSDSKKLFGIDAKKFIKILAKKYNIKEDITKLREERRDYYKDIKTKVKVFPGILKLLKELKKNKIKIALATSSSKASLNHNFKSSKLSKKFFEVINTRDKIKNTKPDPEIFIKTIKDLKLKSEDCIIIEDSIAGVEAAKRAEVNTIAVTNSFPRSKLKKADLIVSSAKELNIKRLECLIQK